MSFSSDLTRFARTMGYRMDYVVQQTLLELGNGMIDMSPVGDPTKWRSGRARPGYVGGLFRGNWQYGEGPNYPRDKFTTKGKPPSKARIEAGVPARAAGKNHWIVNNLPYSIRLEHGWSWNQAPAGIVGVSVMNYRQIVRRQTAAARRIR